MKTGVLIVNIGTPESPSKKDVGIYLKKFLMDEAVIAIPFIFRWILVNLIIVPFRSVQSAAKYAKIWTPEGSPLKTNTELFVKELQSQLPSEYTVKYGMAFSEPSIKTSLAQFKDENMDEIIVCPMFPQYADATTGSVLKAVRKFAKNLKMTAQFKYIKSFYNQEFYTDNVFQKMRQDKPQHWLFSYHGLPADQVSAPTYRSHCEHTTATIIKKLNLKPTDYTMTFQSRLGVQKWLQPYTDDVLKLLPTQGIKNISVVSPAFVADCLETLEEINLESRHTFKESGGEHFNYIQCLNSDQEWVKGFSGYLRDSRNLENL